MGPNCGSWILCCYGFKSIMNMYVSRSGCFYIRKGYPPSSSINSLPPSGVGLKIQRLSAPMNETGNADKQIRVSAQLMEWSDYADVHVAKTGIWNIKFSSWKFAASKNLAALTRQTSGIRCAISSAMPRHMSFWYLSTRRRLIADDADAFAKECRSVAALYSRRDVEVDWHIRITRSQLY